MTAPGTDHGVLFPLVDGRRSTQHTARAVFADAARPVAPDVADRIDRARDWHKSYVAELAALERLGAASAKNAHLVAENGLRSLHERMTFGRDGIEQPLPRALAGSTPRPLGTAALDGAGARAETLAIPYRGRELSGRALTDLVEDWVGRGIVEPSCAAAVRRVAAEPEWLDLRDLRIVLIGAAAEMSPLPSLLRWGAEVVVVDLPRPDVWGRIEAAAAAGAGRVVAPVADTGTPGADLLGQLPEVRGWLHEQAGPFVLGNYAYADGATFVRVAAAADALTADLVGSGHAEALAYLASPTDVFAVPFDVVEAARSGPVGKRGGRRAARPLRAMSGGRLFAANYRDVVDSEEGVRFGLADSVVPQQGPNYALAKRLQRWRAVVARESVVTSANVAPATRTRSVTKNRVLAAAYAGARRYGVEVFETPTSSALMAALLVHDLRNPQAPAHPDAVLRHPLQLFADQAAHGGLWRLPWEPRSVLPLAAVEGLLRRR
jgi:hypothetical protein